MELLKKCFLLSVLIGICTCSVFAQSIRVDRLETDGRRQLMSSSKSLSIEGVDYDICLKVYEDDGYNNRDWLLLVSSFHPIQENGVVLLKLGNDDVLPFYCNNLNVGDITYANSIIKFYSSVYVISELELEDISNYGIKKMRITDGRSYREKEWKKDSLGKFLTKCWVKLKNRLESTTIRKDNIYEGF